MRFPASLLVLPFVTGLPRSTMITPPIDVARFPAIAGDSVNASVRWNRLVPSFVEQAATSRRAARAAAAGDSAALRRIAQTQPPMIFRIYTLLSVAQYGALNAALRDRSVSSDIAVASASAVVLTELFADSGVRASIARELARDLGQGQARSRAGKRAAAGKRLGEEVAARIIAWGPTVNFVAPWNGTIPKGPGMWYSAPGVPPVGISLMNARPWLMESPAQFRPPPPVAYGSPAFGAALEEVRRVTRERTAEQTRIAQHWNAADPWTQWNKTASAAVQRHRLSNAEAVRVLAMLNVAASDAVIACFEAKYHYWTIRPSQVDTSLVLADSVTVPNFPAYPSGHACSAGAFDAVLGHFFPQDRAEFTRIAEEQAMSRLYAGVHYRFDNDAGLALGRTVARYVIDRESKGGLNGWQSGTNARKPLIHRMCGHRRCGVVS